MIRVDAEKPVHFCDGMSRRDFLHAGSLAFLGLSMPEFFALQARGAVRNDTNERNCIFLFLVGGPSQIDTFDPKPEEPAEIRGPYKAIRTNIPGIRISEIFPRTARQADKFAIVRSMHHTAAGVHDTGHQMMQTGRLFHSGSEHPHAGCVHAFLKGPRSGLPAHVLLPHPIGNTGGDMPHGQSAGYLGRDYDPFVLHADPSAPDFEAPDLPRGGIGAVRLDHGGNLSAAVDQTVSLIERSRDVRLFDDSFHRAFARMSSREARAAFDLSREPDALRDAYGRNTFGQACLLARRLIERGVRFVTVNMFETVFNEITWDVHGSAPFSPIESYREHVGPMFDNAYATLLEDLSTRGMLDGTMVVAMGEFGRTPRINPAGGRDHWPRVWSILFAGGGVKGGQVVGSSDGRGAEPRDRPAQPQEVVASVYHSLGISLDQTLPGPQGRPIPVVDPGVQPIHELF